MKVREVMSREVLVAAPNDTIREVAREMARIDAGVLPVRENEQLIGMITDRDIAIRGVGADLDPSTATVRQVMTSDVRFCYEDEDLDEVARDMARLQVRRMPVVDRSKRLVGIVSMADLAQQMKPAKIGETLREVSEPGGRHTQKVPPIVSEREQHDERRHGDGSPPPRTQDAPQVEAAGSAAGDRAHRDDDRSNDGHSGRPIVHDDQVRPVGAVDREGRGPRGGRRRH